MSNVGLAVSRFFAFFFTLMITLAVVIGAYSAVAGQPVDKTWSAVEALVIAAIVLLALAIAGSYVATLLDGHAAGASRSIQPAAADHVEPN